MIGRLRGRATAVPRVPVARGERVLSGAVAQDGLVLVGTRLALYLQDAASTAEPRRVPWEQIQRADWDPDEETFVISEVGDFGEQRVVHAAHLTEATEFLAFVRERVSATLVLQRHVPITAGAGVFVIARRALAGERPLVWSVEFEENVDPTSPQVLAVAEEALARARRELDT